MSLSDFYYQQRQKQQQSSGGPPSRVRAPGSGLPPRTGGGGAAARGAAPPRAPSASDISEASGGFTEDDYFSDLSEETEDRQLMQRVDHHAAAPHPSQLYGGRSRQEQQPQPSPVDGHSHALDGEKDALLKAFYNYRSDGTREEGQHPPQAPTPTPGYYTPQHYTSRGPSNSPPHRNSDGANHSTSVSGGWMRAGSQGEHSQSVDRHTRAANTTTAAAKDNQWSDFFNYAKPANEAPPGITTKGGRDYNKKEVEYYEDGMGMGEQEAEVRARDAAGQKLRSKLYQSGGAAGGAPRASPTIDYFNYRSDMEHQVDTAHYKNHHHGQGLGLGYEGREYAAVNSSHQQSQDAADAAGERFYRKEEKWLEKVGHEKDMLRHEVQQQEEEECTFKPNINAPYKPPAHALQQKRVSGGTKRSGSSSAARARSQSQNGTGGASDIGSRLHSQYADTLARRQEEQQLKEEEEMANLTFQPNVVRSQWVNDVAPRYLDHTISSISGGGGGRPTTPGRRQQMSSYNPESTVLGGTGKPLGFTPSYGVGKMLEQQEAEFTFTPVTNRRVSPTINHYIRTPAFKRLSAPNSRYNSPDRSAIDQDFYDYEASREHNNNNAANNNSSTAGTFVHPGSNGNSFYDSPSRTPGQRGRSATTPRGRGGSQSHLGRRPTTPSRQMSKEEQQSFVDRITKKTYDYPIQQERKRMRDREQQQSASFQPKISEASRRMALKQIEKEEASDALNNNEAAATPGSCTPHNRRLRSLSTATNGANRKPQPGHEACAPQEKLDFTPKIDRRSTELREAWLKNHAEVEARRRKRLERMGQEKEFAEAKELTFKPELSETANHSKGFLKKALRSDDNYQLFLSQQRARREKDLKPHRKDLEEEEKKACTFNPEIHEAPEYIQVIAQTLALTREERERNHHRDNHNRSYRGGDHSEYRHTSPQPMWSNSTELLHRDAPSPTRERKRGSERTPVVTGRPRGASVNMSVREPLPADNRSVNTSTATSNRTPANRPTRR